MKNKLAFVILNYKQSDLVIRDVNNLSEIEPESCFLIIDNNSQDGSVERFEDEFKGIDRIVVIKNDVNCGYAKGNNIGIKKAVELFDPEFIAIMNPDVVVFDKETINIILDSFKKDDKLALCTGLMLDGKKNLDYKKIAWKIPNKLQDCLLNLPFLSRFSITKYKTLKIEDSGLAYVEVIPGSFFIARTRHFLELGLFDESTFLFCEERILALKAKENNFRVAVVPKVFFIHDHKFENVSLKTRITMYFELLKSRFYFNKKYNTWPKIVVIPLFLVSSGIGILLTITSWIIKKLSHKV